MTFADDIAAHRKKAGISQAELARHMKEHGFPWRQTTVSKVEAGRELTLSEASALSTITGVPLPGAKPDALAAELAAAHARIARLERVISSIKTALHDTL